MSYAQAAGSSSSSGQGSHQNPKDRFFNAKMTVCMANGFSYEQLADELNKNRSWKSVSGFQKVDLVAVLQLLWKMLHSETNWWNKA